MYLVRKRLKNFSAAHRLIKGYVGKCADLHGHNYVATVVIGTEQLDQYGFVVDFNDIKRLYDEWLESHVDHATIVCTEDLPLLNFVQQNKQKYYVLPGGKNTSAEAIAEHLFQHFKQLLAKEYPHLILVEIEVAETPSSQVIYREHA